VAYRAFFWAGGAREELGRDASSAAAVSPDGGRWARVGFGGRFLFAKRGRERFSNVAWGAGAPDKLLPRRTCAGAQANYLGFNPHMYEIGLAGGAPILTPSLKIAPAHR
jgi:hypothetical protein